MSSVIGVVLCLSGNLVGNAGEIYAIPFDRDLFTENSAFITESIAIDFCEANLAQDIMQAELRYLE